MMIDKTDIYIIALTFFFSGMLFLLVLAWKQSFPSVATIQEFAATFNTKGGIIMFLWAAWLLTLATTVGFGIWVIVRGVDPQHTVVTIILGMLISQAFGNVNGALFKTMTGDEPKLANQSVTTSTTTQTSISNTDAITTPDASKEGH